MSNVQYPPMGKVIDRLPGLLNLLFAAARKFHGLEAGCTSSYCKNEGAHLIIHMDGFKENLCDKHYQARLDSDSLF